MNLKQISQSWFWLLAVLILANNLSLLYFVNSAYGVGGFHVSPRILGIEFILALASNVTVVFVVLIGVILSGIVKNGKSAQQQNPSA